ncbi:anaerobic ribonucleoside-triphosphate reductase activating protein [Actinoplanes lutulentus]|uniref:Anaerobic ribonucleoside-triphosphate reductase activating protein n=1 Tax=Actinoplanes lutulentus TaxID=1287878 RepID=A0A327ZI69_9ACTN|nr:4Fe-4S single cluster domain-containing protein [Actinoplanes lutulentus]MBB2946867.1 anaerobic ribonucleoside-triphosphate reductase activating protein [Actinoplanes lutulentus]RAK35761.1 anaerobic ribonucleoside-triphosphate reductase activating protein [Actinoplanes lutulentus]
MKLRLARTHHPVTTLGPGRRIGIWVQGCGIGCPGCVARDTWVAEPRHDVEVADVLAWCARHIGDAAGVTITGGEPSEQPAALAELVHGLHALNDDWDVLCYTGVEFDEFERRCPEALTGIDALITGPFRITEPTDLVWRGSANQRLIPCSERGEQRYRRWALAERDRPELQLQVGDERVWMIGIPGRGDLARLQRVLRDQGIELEGVSWRP